MRKLRRFRIQKGVPIPKPNNATRETVYPFARMKKGDSFGFPAHLLKTIDSGSRKWQKRHRPKWKFAGRKMSKTKARLWRLK